MNVMLALALVEDGGAVSRFHTRRMVNRENVAEHSFTVAWVCAMFYPDNQVPVKLLMAALQHDLPEFVTGVTTPPIKRSSEKSKAACVELEQKVLLEASHFDYMGFLNDDETFILKFADSFSGLLTCLREMAMGNTEMSDTGVVYMESLSVQRDECPTRLKPVVKELLDYVRSKAG